MGDFVHLHLHSEYSLLDGACRIKQLVQRAKQLGQRAIAVTDHGCMYGTIEFYNEAKKEGIKPIIGCEVYVAPRTRHDKEHKLDKKPYHLILLCKDIEGYHNLTKLVSIGYIEGFYNKPRIDIEVLKKYSKGLICLSACLAGEIARKLVDNDYEGAKSTALQYREIFGEDNYYLEIQNHGIEEQIRILPLIYKLSEETGIPLIATNDAHYISREDAKMQNVLLCIQTGTTLDQPNGMGFATDEFYIKSAEEMEQLFKSHPEAIENTVKIAERCNVDFEFGVIKLPKFEIEGVNDNIEYFRNLCYQGLKNRYGGNLKQEYIDRMEYEFNIIIKMGYVDYFLIVWDFIKYARDNNIPVGPGRGSGAGSICAYCIEITGIDPMKYNLLFERFLNPERVSMPDFDIDFCIEGRQRVIDYVIRRYGSDRVAQIITFGTMAAKGSIRDTGRVMGMSYQLCDKVSKLIPTELNITIDKALKKNSDLLELYNSDKEVHELVDMARKVEGMPRHTSTHAAGVVIASAPVSDFVPLQKTEESIVTQYTMTVLESLGLLKMDFLGLRNLTVIRDTEINIRKNIPDFNIHDISVNDEEVYKMLSEGKTSGVFQFESAGMRQVMMRLEPDSIEDIIAVISLYRPGPMDSIPRYIQNRHNPEQIKYDTPLLKPILDVTYGCIVYQEQVMEICRSLAGYSYGRADLVRRAMSKKKHDVMEKERRSFIYGDKNEDGSVNCVGAIANGVPEEIADKIFDQMNSFASYAFNKSHAAAYAYLSYQTAYLRCHHFKEYMSALMTSVLMNTPKLMEYITECEANGVKVLKPHINESCEGFTITDDGIHFGLLAIKSLGKGVIEEIVNERDKNGEYNSFQDFCERMYNKSGMNKRALESLIKAGAFDGMGLNRRQMLENMSNVLDLLHAQEKQQLEGQLDLFGMMNTETTEKTSFIEFPKAEEYPVKELLKMEKEITGMYISGHPVARYSLVSQLLHFPTLTQLTENVKEHIEGYNEGDTVHILCSIQEAKAHITKNNAQMCFMTLEDVGGMMECVVFPNSYQQFRNILTVGEIISLTAKISIRDDEPSLIFVDAMNEENFNKYSKSKRLCIKLNTFEENIFKEICSLAENYTGEHILCFYFKDSKKTIASKNRMGVNLSKEFFKKLQKYVKFDDIGLF